MDLQHLSFDSTEELSQQGYYQCIYSLRAAGTPEKWRILGCLPNWPFLGIPGTFGATVSGRKLSDDCTLSAY